MEQGGGGSWRCPVCGESGSERRFEVTTDAGENGVGAASFRPSTSGFGHALGVVLRCTTCGHGAVAESPDEHAVAEAYADAVDEVSLREEAGQVETADRGVALIERWAAPGRLVDIGCWTGSFVEAAARRGWDASGVEPGRWASDRARARGLQVTTGDLETVPLHAGAHRAVVACDVLEHLADPGAAVDRLIELVEPGGVLYLTVPDAGSALARVMGRRWWSVLPMHLQYFTRASMRRLLTDRGLRVEHVGTHAKVFTARYYAERLAGYSTALGRVAVGATERVGVADRMVAPDFRDRMVVIARRG
jgi:SAM-dependent methyltransferase